MNAFNTRCSEVRTEEEDVRPAQMYPATNFKTSKIRQSRSLGREREKKRETATLSNRSIGPIQTATGVAAILLGPIQEIYRTHLWHRDVKSISYTQTVVK